MLKNVYCGHCNNLRISYIGEHLPDYISKYSILITCLDSTVDFKSGAWKWKKYLEDSHITHQLSKSWVYVEMESVPKLLKDGMTFSHFDEVFLLPGKIDSEIEITEHYTSEKIIFSSQASERLMDKMERIGARIFLADGCGLNFVCLEKADADVLFKLSDGTLL